VGAANLARKILRAVMGNEPDVPTPKTMRRTTLVG
jgi:hypothetical protein